MTRPLLVGVLVGGRATRMGGVVKGMLRAPDTSEPLVTRLVRVCREALPDADYVLVGNASPYDALGLAAIADDPAGEGPLGGLHALLRESNRRHRDAIALACDLPYVTATLVTRLATVSPEAAAVAPQISGRWEPLFARYDAAICEPLAKTWLDSERRALRAVLDALGDRAVPLPLTADEATLLRDWDAPGDVE